MHRFAILTSTSIDCLQFAYDLKLLPRAMDCDACESPMEKVHDICKLDGNRWLCGHIKCKTTNNARIGTWFEKSKLTRK